MKSAFVVPAHWSENCRAASSTTPRSFTPRDASSPIARLVSKVASTGDSTAPVICEPTSCITAPVFAILPSAAFAFWSLETVPLTLDVTPDMGPVRLSIMFMMRDNRNTDSKLILCLSPPNRTAEATLCS